MSVPTHKLPPGAARWDITNNVAIRTGKTVKQVVRWCDLGLVHAFRLAGGYGGVWVAVDAHGWPLDGPKVEDYRRHRGERAKKGASIGAARSVAVRAAKRAKNAALRGKAASRSETR